jgi:hypothetical protein
MIVVFPSANPRSQTVDRGAIQDKSPGTPRLRFGLTELRLITRIITQASYFMAESDVREKSCPSAGKSRNYSSSISVSFVS